MQRSTGYIKTKGQVSGLISRVRPEKFKVVTHKRRVGRQHLDLVMHICNNFSVLGISDVSYF